MVKKHCLKWIKCISILFCRINFETRIGGYNNLVSCYTRFKVFLTSKAFEHNLPLTRHYFSLKMVEKQVKKRLKCFFGTYCRVNLETRVGKDSNLCTLASRFSKLLLFGRLFGTNCLSQGPKRLTP